MKTRISIAVILTLAMYLILTTPASAVKVYDVDLGDRVSGFRVEGTPWVWVDLNTTVYMTYSQQQAWAEEKGFQWASRSEIYDIVTILGPNKFTRDIAKIVGAVFVSGEEYDYIIKGRCLAYCSQTRHHRVIQLKGDGLRRSHWVFEYCVSDNEVMMMLGAWLRLPTPNVYSWSSK